MEDAIFYFVFWIALYFSPSIVAAARHKKNGVAIFAMNFFLGWTLIGWVVALVWALTHENKAVKE